MKIPIRIDEAYKTLEQLNQRNRTYEAAETLNRLGIECEVREFFTGDSKTADAAGIFLKMVELL